VGKAKAHVFLDVEMGEVVKPTHDYEVTAGAGSKVVITIGPSVSGRREKGWARGVVWLTDLVVSVVRAEEARWGLPLTRSQIG